MEIVHEKQEAPSKLEQAAVWVAVRGIVLLLPRAISAVEHSADSMQQSLDIPSLPPDNSAERLA